ncbi:hypothetical protein [Nannocystis pusilla]|uniref:hypothetical protein n=1 Tax=Nannocystis pusilla TaxID=889268 RepID=UPI003B7D1D49
MNRRPSFYLCALALAGCPGGGSDSTGSSGGPAGSTSGGSESETGEPTAGSTGMTTGTGTSGPVQTTSTGEEPTTGEPTTGPVATTSTSTSTTTGDTDTDTTGEPGGPAPDWALVDVNPNSATYEQTRARSDYAGQVSGWYFAHAT